MGLLKTKPILFSSNFSHSTDPFYADNLKYKTVSQSQIPNDSTNIVVKKSQAVFFTVDNVLQKLLDNDKYINTYIQKLQNTSISKERAEEAFTQNVESLDTSCFYDTYQNHLSVHHNKKYVCPDGISKFTQLEEIYNKRLRNDFSNFDIDSARGAEGVDGTFLHKRYEDSSTGRLSSYQQDIVINIEYDDTVNCPTNYIAVYVCNDYTDNKFSTTLSKHVTNSIINQIPTTNQTKYIYKEWLSGMKEFYIYIPSTFTFYTEQLGEYGPDGVTGAEKPLNPHTKCTWIRVVMNKRHFKLNHIYQMEICGQSLPLQIHANKYSYFNDCPQPSIVRTVCMSNNHNNNTDCIYDEETNMFTMYFCCYGTDAQAIRILAD